MEKKFRAQLYTRFFSKSVETGEKLMKHSMWL